MPGLYGKYIILHSDGTPTEGQYFVLKPATDPAAREAIQAYADATDDLDLYDDLLNWMADIALEASCKGFGDLELQHRIDAARKRDLEPKKAYLDELARRGIEY